MGEEGWNYPEIEWRWPKKATTLVVETTDKLMVLSSCAAHDALYQREMKTPPRSFEQKWEAVKGVEMEVRLEGEMARHQ